LVLTFALIRCSVSNLTNKMFYYAKMRTWIYQNKFVSEPDAPEWLNLDSGRKKLKPESTDMSLEGIRILGSREQLAEFWNENKNGLLLPTVYQKGADFNKVIYRVFDNLAALVSSKVCSRAQVLLLDQNYLSIHDVPDEVLDKICPWSLGGLFTAARLNEILDGDTIIFSIFLSGNEISQCNRAGKNCAGVIRDGILATKFKGRLFGKDAAEKNTAQGPIDTADLARRLPKNFWVQFMPDDEKFGRELITIYLDREKKELFIPPGVGYMGGKKK